MTDLNVSLEPHLVEQLRPLVPLLPAHDAQRLEKCLTDDSEMISYSLLKSISQWSRSAEGSNALKSISLDPTSYTIVGLLAGATTSPDRHFPAYEPPKDPEEVAAEQARERKAITTIVNALLSVLGCGLAAWWASANAGWRNEWRALFALLVAAIVAISETGLYLLWQSRRSTTKSRLSAKHKKKDTDLPDKPDKTDSDSHLRHRVVATRDRDQ